ncbi:MAG: DUF1820 family protein [Gammaproteobacteria bacterium]|jgi:hypothetical protein|nr:DUF1820 family protein [Gammaproteobacteria bacterium]
MAAKKTTYRISFLNQGKVYEIYARNVQQSGIFGFIEVEKLLFGEKSTLLVDPSEEHLKSEFEGVSRTYIPMHAVLRIDEVEKSGHGKITRAEGSSDKIAPFPVFAPGQPSPKS